MPAWLMKHEFQHLVHFRCSLRVHAARYRIAASLPAAPKREAVQLCRSAVHAGIIPYQHVCIQLGSSAPVTSFPKDNPDIEIKPTIVPRYGRRSTASAPFRMDCALCGSVPCAAVHDTPDRYAFRIE